MIGHDPHGYRAELLLPPREFDESVDFRVRITNTSDSTIVVPPHRGLGLVASRPPPSRWSYRDDREQSENWMEWSFYEDPPQFIYIFGGIDFRRCLSSQVQFLRPGESTELSISLHELLRGAGRTPGSAKVSISMYGTLHEFLIEPPRGVKDWSEVTHDMVTSARFAPGIPPPPPRSPRSDAPQGAP
jgi:hypothetical protein